jgi:group I intron endonuclease
MNSKEQKSFIVYMATNTVNGKRYIGKTAKLTFKKRRDMHYFHAKNGKYTSPIFHKAIAKYGKESFAWSILVEVLTDKEALSEEVRLIAELHPEYNITLGGQGVSGISRSRESLETISKPVICLNDGKEYPSGQTAADAYGLNNGRVSIVCRNGGSTKGYRFKFKGGDEPPLDVYRSPEAIEKHRMGVEAGRLKAIDKCRIPIVCVDTGEKFKSVVEASEKFGFVSSSLYSSLRRKQRCGGYRFVFEKDFNSSMEVSTRDPLSPAGHGARRVICLNDDRLFDSVSDVSTFYKLERTMIDRHLKGDLRNKSDINGMKFSYLDEWCPNPL